MTDIIKRRCNPDCNIEIQLMYYNGTGLPPVPMQIHICKVCQRTKKSNYDIQLKYIILSMIKEYKEKIEHHETMSFL